jgi:hypothetical protein
MDTLDGPGRHRGMSCPLTAHSRQIQIEVLAHFEVTPRPGGGIVQALQIAGAPESYGPSRRRAASSRESTYRKKRDR